MTLTILLPLFVGLKRSALGMQLRASKLSLGRFKFYDFIPFVIIFLIYSCYLSDSIKIGSVFCLSLLIVLIVAYVSFVLLQKLIQKIFIGKTLSYPHLYIAVALRNIMRSGHKQLLSFMALSLGVTLISFIMTLDSLVQKELAFDPIRPSLFLFDIQEEQIDELLHYSVENNTPLDAVTSLIRARIKKINGVIYQMKGEVNIRDASADQESRMRSTGMNITIRDELSSSEKMVKGFPFPKEKDPNRLPFISLETRWASRMGIKIGDKLTFDIQGVEFEGIVRNLRDVKWTTFRPNFFVAIESGYIDLAPKTFLAVLNEKDINKKRDFLMKVNSVYPNVSMIDVEELTKKMYDLFERASFAIKLISFLCLSIGLIILYGFTHDQIYRRKNEIALLKTLGLEPLQLLFQILIEFGFIFVSALFLGVALGWIMAQLIGQEIFKLSIDLNFEVLVKPLTIICCLCLLTVLLAAWRTVNNEPRVLLNE